MPTARTSGQVEERGGQVGMRVRMDRPTDRPPGLRLCGEGRGRARARARGVHGGVRPHCCKAAAKNGGTRRGVVGGGGRRRAGECHDMEGGA